MASTSHPLRRIIARFFPRKYTSGVAAAPGWERLTGEQRKDLALNYLAQGELALLQGDLKALSLFEAASQIDPDQPQIWFRQGLAFFEYGSEEGKEKALLLASKYFKFATQRRPEFFEAWVAWGNTLLQLGRFHAELHFLTDAKEKYQQALELADGQPPDLLGELHWDYGIAWTEIARSSGEALDLRLAIDAFHRSLSYQKEPPPECLKDMGEAYLDLGLLINDTRLFLQAIEWLQQAVEIAPEYKEGWISLAESFSQLYLSTLDERFVAKASHAFDKATQWAPRDADVWLNWAQILGESGRLNNDLKQMRLSSEKAARAHRLDPKNLTAIAQIVEMNSLIGAKTNRLDLIIEAEQKILKATDAFPDDPDLWHAYGICCIAFARYYEEGEYYDMAIEKLQIGLSIDRTSAEHWHTLALAHKQYADLVQHEDLLERANRFFARAMDLKPAYPALLFDAACSLLHFSELVDDLPSLEKALGYFETLLQHYKEALLHHPEWIYETACALEWLGSYSNDENHYTRAIELFTHVLLIDPDFPLIYSHIAHCYVELGLISCEAEFYKRATHFFRLALRQDEENDKIWLSWGICLIHLAHHCLDEDTMRQYYWEAEQKITRAGRLGNPSAYYTLACLYSILERADEAMELIHKALAARALPTVEEMLDDVWLSNLCTTEQFAHFLNVLEAKFQAREE